MKQPSKVSNSLMKSNFSGQMDSLNIMSIKHSNGKKKDASCSMDSSPLREIKVLKDKAPSLKPNLMSIISLNKRNDGRAEILERRRREYLVRNSHNKMYLLNNPHQNQEIKDQLLKGKQIKISGKGASLSDKKVPKIGATLSYIKQENSPNVQIPVVFKSLNDLAKIKQKEMKEKIRQISNSGDKLQSKEPTNLSLYLEAPLLQLHEVEKKESSYTESPTNREFEVNEKINIKHVEDKHLSQGNIKPQSKKSSPKSCKSKKVEKSCGQSRQVVEEAHNQDLIQDQEEITLENKEGEIHTPARNISKPLENSQKVMKHLPVKSFEMNYDPTILPQKAKNLKVSNLARKPGSPSKGISLNSRKGLKPITSKGMSECKDDTFIDDFPSLERNQKEYQSFYKPIGDYSQMHKTIQDSIGKKNTQEIYDYQVPMTGGFRNKQSREQYQSVDTESLYPQLYNLPIYNDNEHGLQIECKGTSFKSRFHIEPPKETEAKSNLRIPNVSAKSQEKEELPRKEEFEEKEKQKTQRSESPDNGPKAIATGMESPINTLYSPMQTRGNFKPKLSEVIPITNAQYHRQSSNPSNIISSPPPESIYHTRVNISKKKKPRKCQSMGLSNRNSTDDPALNLVLLQLSQQGKTFEDMQKEMTKQERIRNIIEKNIENERQKVMGQFKINYQTGGAKDFVNKIFPKKQKKNDKKEEGLLEDIKNWANISLDEGNQRNQEVNVSMDNVKPRHKYHKSHSFMNNISAYKEEYFLNKQNSDYFEENSPEKQIPKQISRKKIIRSSTLIHQPYHKSMESIESFKSSDQPLSTKILRMKKPRYSTHRRKFFHMRTIENNFKILNDIVPSIHND